MVVALIVLAAPTAAGARRLPVALQGVSPDVTLDELLQLPGDQVVRVPDGVYDGVTVAAPHPETDGALGGWLVLVPETQGGAVITGDLTLEESTSRVMFVGFRFEQARVFNFGREIRYWYTDHVHPDVEWYTAGRPIPRQFFVRNPATDVGVFGGDFHDGVASPINLSGADRIEFAGIKVFDLSEPPGSDPEDLSHLNTISLLGGDVEDLVVRDSMLEGARANHQTDQGDVVGLRYQDVWYSGAFGSAFQFNATNGNRIIDGERVGVRSWDHRGDNPRDRLDIVDGQQYEPEARPDRVDVRDRSVLLAAPPRDEPDPATRWRSANPYASWNGYFEWPVLEPVPPPTDSPSPVVPIVIGAAAGVLALAGLTLVWRRRRA